MKIFDGFKYNTTHGVLTAVARKDGGFDFYGGAYRVDADGTTYWMRPTTMHTPFKVLGIFEEPIAPPLVAGAWYATDDGPKLCHAGYVVGSYKCTRDGMRNGERYALHKLENYQPAIAPPERTVPVDEQSLQADPMRAVCVMRVSATVEVQVMVDYYPDTTAAHIKEEAEKMAHANLPKGVTVLEVQGLDIRL